MTEQEWPFGLTIVAIRPLSQKTADSEGWDTYQARDGLEIVLSDGSILYPAQDHEGNGAGVLFGIDNYERAVTIAPAA